MTSSIIPLPFVLLNLSIWKVWKRRGTIIKTLISREQKELLDEIKKFFTVFEGLSFGEKI